MRAPSTFRVARRTTAALTAGVLSASMLSGHAASAAASQTITVAARQAIYQIGEGGSATVVLTAETSDNKPLSSDTPIAYSTGSGTATAGIDYTPASGTLTFAKGSPSGTAQHVNVAVRRDHTATERAETIPLVLRSATGAVIVSTKPTVVINAHGMAYLDRRLPVKRRVSDLLARMSLEDKVGQMAQAERGAVASDPNIVARLRLGSVLSGGGSVPTPNTPAAWVETVNALQQQAMSTGLQIPLIYGVDAVHGHGNVHGATIFPHNIGLGATRDPALIERVYHATAVETRATGVPWDFAPCLCVSRDERWDRTYESFGEDPALVTKLETAIDGLQGRRPGQLDDPDRVLATVKHYAGDGDIRYGTSTTGEYTIDQGVTVTSRADFARVDLAPYVPAVRRHRAGSVMPSFSSVDFTDDGVGNPVKMHAHKELITGMLKNRIGFDGFVVSDWEGIHQLPDPAAPAGAPASTAGQVRAGVNAGIDMFMEPNSAGPFIQALRTEVSAGRVTRARIDDAVRRILTAKFTLGLFEQPFAPADRVEQVGSAAHRTIARQAVARSQVLLKNTGRVLPLRRDATVYVAGRNADDIGNQAGGWTLDWQGRSGDTIPGTTILDGIRQVAPRARVTYSPDASAPAGGADVGIAVVGETPYAEGYGDVGGPSWPWGTEPQKEPKSLTLQPADRAVIDKVCDAVRTCVVLVVSGRPQVITDQLGKIDALVASWLPGSEGAGVADVLFGRAPFTGRLPMTWPRTTNQVPINVGDRDYRPLYPFGWGLRTDSARGRLVAAAGVNPAPAVRRLLTADNWHPDGSLRPTAATTANLQQALRGTGSAALREAIVSAARDNAQTAVSSEGPRPNAAALLAEADRADLTGNPRTALDLLVKATTQ